MKEFAKFFTRRYSSVNGNDEQYLSSGIPTSASMLQQCTNNISDKDRRRKSLKPNHSMSTAGILSSFFNERQGKQQARSPKCAFLLLALGVLAITTAVMVKIIQPYDMIFKWKLLMQKDGEIFNLWAKPPVDLYIKIYLFNITNAEAFMEGKEKMNVQQVGPYVYKEILTHENITFNENGTMSTIPSHPLVWQENLSEGHKEDDQVVMLNIAMLAISHLTSDHSFFVRLPLRGLFKSSESKPIVRMTAREFMFGYPSALTKLGNSFLPNWISFDKVGLIDRMYDFEGDYETFYTGINNTKMSGLYATYRGQAELPQWKNEHCNNIDLASDGTKFSSFLQPNESVKFFRKSMCRPIQLYRTGESETHGSLSGYKYLFEENALDNGRHNEKNKCYCREGYCQPEGLVDVTECYYGFPISLSYPHFMSGDSGLIQNITGMEPKKENHSSVFVIQPESGLPLSLSVKMQINMHFKRLNYPEVERFSHLTVPMLWFEIMMPKLPDSLDTRFNFYLNILPYLDILGFWGSLALGVGLLVYAVTRATLRMSNISENTQKYGKANMNLLVPTITADGVYNPCEMKLIQTNEKKPFTQKLYKNVITRNGDEEEAENCEMSYTEIRRSIRRQSSYALELEPALSETECCSSDESDEGHVSLKSTSSSSMKAENEKEHTPSISSSGISSGQDETTSLISEISSNSNSTNNSSSSEEQLAVWHGKSRPIYEV